MLNNQFLTNVLDANAPFINIATETIQHECILLEEQSIALEKLYNIIDQRTKLTQKKNEIKSKLHALLNNTNVVIKRSTCAAANPCNNCDECDQCDLVVRQMTNDISTVNIISNLESEIDSE